MNESITWGAYPAEVLAMMDRLVERYDDAYSAGQHDGIQQALYETDGQTETEAEAEAISLARQGCDETAAYTWGVAIGIQQARDGAVPLT